MFEKILIANRGEIACRIIRTCKKLGIKTVAVFSDADQAALHVRIADEAVHIGGAKATESYLMAERIVAACAVTGADAVHPGYGFLSEDAEFALALAQAGVTFIGPRIEAIQSMGDKILSKKKATKAGVSVAPGFLGVLPSSDAAIEATRTIGYPVMLKASAGGGGRGMRVCRNDDELAAAFVQASREAESAFGDERMFIERYIEQPRHIEIQVLGDRYGNVIHLGERECSIQRRHQKVIEEAPSPFIDEETRAAMGAQAVALAKAVDYSSAGTVEFIVDQKRNFYFLEMNTRIQVEHPVTELVTGLDIVEEMIRHAAGERLRYQQSDIKLKGWAIEARVYAEDPARDFFPSPGLITEWTPPAEGPATRVDTGIFTGSEISLFYDPMIAKVIGFGADRAAAIEALSSALAGTTVSGVKSNVAFLAAVLRESRFVAGDLSTDFIKDIWPKGFGAKP
ncbi:MAG: acetyl-CoA carboxylase biotin carboxylase subunit [Alphaproteobacteria bacterium]|nr:acetyl-CoA carboxylase biotin carboxylase subunit [Alphaproteobacteria bacterium]